MKRNAILTAVVVVAIAGCSPPQSDLKSRLVTDIRKLECEIGYAAMTQMRRSNRLPDPYMVRNCEFDPRAIPVDITPTLDGSVARTPMGILFISRMENNRFPDKITAQISKSTSFAEIAELIQRLNSQ